MEKLRRKAKYKCVEDKGLLRVSVEAQAVPLTKAGTFKGSKSDAVIKPKDDIAISVWFKRGRTPKWGTHRHDQ